MAPQVEAPPDLAGMSSADLDPLAGALRKALESRRAYLRENPDDEEEDEDASQWDD
jgi:hypothetical protein